MKNDFENGENTDRLQSISSNIIRVQEKINKEERKTNPNKEKIRVWKSQLSNLQRAIDKCRKKTEVYA